MNSPVRYARPLDLLALFITGILGGVLMGAFSNAVNGLVSPIYFVNIMGWQGVDGIWRASISQGMLEGLVLGVVLSPAFTIIVAITTRNCCPYKVAARHLLSIFAGILAFWAAAGLFAICLSALAPDLYRFAIIGVPINTVEMLKYAWVGGSIMGAEIGGIFCAIVGAAMFPRRWKAYLKAEEARGFQLTQ